MTNACVKWRETFMQRSRLRLVTVRLPEEYVDRLDELAKRGIISTRSEGIRMAIRELLQRESWREVWKT